MAAEYLTSDGDMVDEIAFRHYGSTVGTVEAIYDANRDLAELGPVLSAGVRIVLPDVAVETDTRVKLWD